MKKTKIIGLLMLVHAVAFQASADSVFRSYREGRTDLDFTLNYFKTTSNFAAGGTKADLPSGYYLQTIDTTAQARYVLMNDFALFAGLNVASVESADLTATRTNSTLNKVFLGSDFQLFNSSLVSLTGEVSVIQSLEKVKSDTDSVLNSDGATEVVAQVGSVFNLDGYFPFLKGGVNYRTEGLSTLLLYTAGIEKRFDETAIGALLTGYTSVKNDDYTDQTTYRDSVTSRVDAFSKKYYSINPSLLDSELYFKYKFNKDILLKFFAGYTVMGSNSAVGIHAGGTLSWTFGGSAAYHSIPQKDLEPRKVPPVRPTVHVPPANSFKEDTNDGVNQNYFKPVAPSKQEIVEPPEDDMVIIPLKKGNAPPPKNDGEYKIQLKKVKKKKTSNP